MVYLNGGQGGSIIRRTAWFRQLITFLLAAVLLSGGLFGCSRSDDRSSAASGSSVSDTASLRSDSRTSSGSDSDSLPAPVKSSSRARREVTDNISTLACADASDIYDITSLCSTERASLLAYGMYDQQRVLLIYLTSSQKMYRAVLLDLSKRNMTQVAAWKNAVNEKQDYAYVKVLSCRPLVVFDSVGNVIYRPGTDIQKAVACSESDSLFSNSDSTDDDGNPYALSSDDTDASVQCLDGNVYLSDPDGFLRELKSSGKESNKGSSLHEVWSLPYTYSYFTPVHMDDEDRLTFLTYPQTDSSQAVFVAVDPQSGEYDCYTCNTQTFYDTEDDGYLFSTYYDSYPTFTVCSRQKQRLTARQLPQSISDKLAVQPDAQGNYPSDGGDVPILATCVHPSEGDLCLFSLDDSYGSGVSALYLMDLSEADWQSWTPPDKAAYTLPVTDYGDLTKKAEKLEKKYGLKIEMGVNVPTSFADYDAVQASDTGRISSALDSISDVLTLYPEGYFADVSDGYYRDIVLYLTGTLTPHDAGSNIEDAGGFTTESSGLAVVAFNIDYDLGRGTIIHELTHVLDYRLEGMNEIDDAKWNRLNPAGFDYYYSYIDANGNSYEYTGSDEYTPAAETDPDRIWFVDAYSKTYPMEDRARLMEYLLQNPDSTEDYFGGEPIQAKLTWYFNRIRKAVGADDWPDETAWEKALRRASRKTSEE